MSYPSWICADCGKKYGKRPEGNGCATWHVDVCDICRTRTLTTEPRDFGHLKDGYQNHFRKETDAKEG